VKVEQFDVPRRFTVLGIGIAHSANIELEDDEQVTFVTGSGTEFDVVRKSWGYYGTPSLNQRLPDNGLRPVLVRGDRSGKMYVLFVENGKEADFYEYVEWDQMTIVCWLDNHQATDAMFGALSVAAPDGDAPWLMDSSQST
jgi:hypothetical protein